MHGVSLGEVQLLRPLVEHFQRAQSAQHVVLSTSTLTGMQVAKKSLPHTTSFYCPLDFSWAIKQALTRLQAALIVLGRLGSCCTHLDRPGAARKIDWAVVIGAVSVWLSIACMCAARSSSITSMRRPACRSRAASLFGWPQGLSSHCCCRQHARSRRTGGRVGDGTIAAQVSRLEVDRRAASSRTLRRSRSAFASQLIKGPASQSDSQSMQRRRLASIVGRYGWRAEMVVGCGGAGAGRRQLWYAWRAEYARASGLWCPSLANVAFGPNCLELAVWQLSLDKMPLATVLA